MSNIIRCVFNYRQFISSLATYNTQKSIYQESLNDKSSIFYIRENRKLNVFMTDTQRVSEQAIVSIKR